MDNVMEITEGISEGDRIVNNPSAALLEGDQVIIVTPTPGYQNTAEPPQMDLSIKEVPSK
jgi:hypothetical protein